MLTVDLVRVRRRQKVLEISPLSKAARLRVTELAGHYIAIARTHVGRTRGELDESLFAVQVHTADRKVAAGLRKLVADRCEFEIEAGIDPIELRRALFGQASRARKALEPGQRFDPTSVRNQVAARRDLPTDELDRLLYIDLRDAHRLLSFDPLGPQALVELYELGQVQAVLLRAVRVVATVRCNSPGTYRALFHKLKFLRLLHDIERITDDHEWADGYRITIDGPYSLFRSVTKYGLQLAMVLPALRACNHWALQADILWGKDRKPCTFLASSAEQAGTAATASEPASLLDHPEDVTALLTRFQDRHAAGKTAWQASPSAEILALPGVGVCIPDLYFEHTGSGARIYLEVMGFWSRDAVWRRVELVERGLTEPILFAVSSRLRVSEAVLDDNLPSALYVYKGAMNPASIEEQLDRLAGRQSAQAGTPRSPADRSTHR